VTTEQISPDIDTVTHDGPEYSTSDGVLGSQELAVLRVLHESIGRVVSRRELARRVGLADRNERRCDSLLVGLRRVLGPHAITTVRSRGWMLEPHAGTLVSSLLMRHD
jgi:DNA-binding response OmpR family regulator